MRLTVISVSALFLGGCALGSDYAGPPGLALGRGAGEFNRATAETPPSPPLERWWLAFNDPQLDVLIEQALAASPDVASARARLGQALAQLNLDRAKRRPAIDAQPAYVHAKVPGLGAGGAASGQSGSEALDIYNLGGIASWEIDLFGAHQNSLRAGRAMVKAGDAALADVQVSLTAQVAQAYVELRDRQQRAALATQMTVLRREALALARQRFAAGTASEAGVAQAEGEEADGQVELIALNAEIQSLLGALAVLAGAAPGALDLALQQTGPVPKPPISTPVGDVAQLVRRRPDIRAAEQKLAASDALIGVSRAAAFPRLKLLGIVGVGGASLEALGNGDLTLIGVPTLQWSFLDFGRNRARVRQSEASRDDAEAIYRKAVLRALQDVESALSQFDAVQRRLAAREHANQASAASAGLAQQRYNAGTATRTDIIEENCRFLTRRQSVVSAQSAVAAAYIDLNKSLGLGWRASS